MYKIKKILTIIYFVFKNPLSFIRLVKGATIWFSENKLLRLANKFNTDKGFIGHGYVRVYNSIFTGKRKSIAHFCEIGLLRSAGKNKKNIYSKMPSLKMWSQYFPNSHIVGFDIEKFQQPKEKKCTFVQGDQSSRDDLQKIIDVYSGYDVILEDGLHAPRHQQITLSFLFKAVKPGGVFIIEDLQAVIGDEGWEDIPRTIDLLKKLKNSGVWESPLATKEEKLYLEKTVDSIMFFDSLKFNLGARESTDALAVIVKK